MESIPADTKFEDQTLEAAEAFVANYITMNGRPPHRPDVLKYCFEQGVAFAEGRFGEIRAFNCPLCKGAHWIGYSPAVGWHVPSKEPLPPTYQEIEKERDEARAEVERLKSFGAIQTENPQPAFMWALVLRENGKRKVAFSFDGPLSNAYVKLVKASEADRWRGLAEKLAGALEIVMQDNRGINYNAARRVYAEFEKAKGE